MEKIAEKEILKEIFRVISQEEVKCIYNQKHDNPCLIPVLVVTKNKGRYCHYTFKCISATITGEKDFYLNLNRLNPLITEQIIEGERIFGADFYFSQKAISELEVKLDSIRYLENMAEQYLLSAQRYFWECTTTLVPPSIYRSILFASFAKHYMVNPEVTTVKKLLKEKKRWPLLCEVNELVGRGRVLDSDVYRQLFDQAAKFFKEVRTQNKINIVCMQSALAQSEWYVQ